MWSHSDAVGIGLAQDSVKMLGSCYPSTEVLLMALLRGLLRERVLPPGAIIDAGANTGYEACQLAAAAPERTVHAVDPDSANVRSIATLGKMHNLTNLRPLRGGLGEKSALIHMRTSSSSGFGLKRADARGGLLQIHSIDDLFAGSRGALALAHFDLEGMELDVLNGASLTLARDRPVFTVEMHPHVGRNASLALLRRIDALGYRAFIIEEVCGFPFDCRNVLCLPAERQAIFANSPVLDTLVASRRLFAITVDTLHQHAFPCCAAGGECCRAGEKGCCTWVPLKRWFMRQRTGHEDGDGLPQLQARLPYTPPGALQSRDPKYRFVPADELVRLQSFEAAYWRRDERKGRLMRRRLREY